MMLVPSGILAVVLVAGLMPDIAMHEDGRPRRRRAGRRRPLMPADPRSALLIRDGAARERLLSPRHLDRRRRPSWSRPRCHRRPESSAARRPTPGRAGPRRRRLPARPVPPDRAVGPDRHRGRPRRRGLGRLVHLHPMPVVLPQDHGGRAGAPGGRSATPGQVRQHLGRPRARHARRPGRYAEGLGADPDRWWFLTGTEAAIYDLILKRFHLTVAENAEADPEPGVEAFRHSTGSPWSTGATGWSASSTDDPEAVGALVARAKRLARRVGPAGCPRSTRRSTAPAPCSCCSAGAHPGRDGSGPRGLHDLGRGRSRRCSWRATWSITTRSAASPFRGTGGRRSSTSRSCSRTPCWRPSASSRWSP